MDKPKNIFEFEDSGPKVVEPNHYLDDNRSVYKANNK